MTVDCFLGEVGGKAQDQPDIFERFSGVDRIETDPVRGGEGEFRAETGKTGGGTVRVGCSDFFRFFPGMPDLDDFSRAFRPERNRCDS